MAPWYHLTSRAGPRTRCPGNGGRPSPPIARFSGAAPGRASRAASRELPTSRSLSGLRAARLIPVIAFFPRRRRRGVDLNTIIPCRWGFVNGEGRNFSLFHKAPRPPPGKISASAKALRAHAGGG